MNDRTRCWLWFALTFHPGNEKIWQMIYPYGDVIKAYEAVRDGDHILLDPYEKKAVKETHIEQCDSIIKYCRENNYTILTYDDDNYPEMLKNIYNPPAVLFCMGDVSIFNRCPAISCVGTRRHSAYSTAVTRKICAELAKKGFIIVSGFSLGIDSAAHIGALKAGGKTAAVLVCGLDYDYPEENARYKDIVAQRGAVITEYFPGTRPDRYSFHKRNRIIAGLSFGTVIFEASERSGSLTTAEHALSQDRIIFCIPPADIFDKRYSGVVKYLRNGAVPVFSDIDIVNKYNEYKESGSQEKEKSDNSFPEISSRFNEAQSDPKAEEEQEKSDALYDEEELPYGEQKIQENQRETDNTNSRPVSDSGETEQHSKKILCDITEKQRDVLLCIRGKELLPDDIIEASGLDAMEVFAILTELEVMGALIMSGGGRYTLSDQLQNLKGEF